MKKIFTILGTLIFSVYSYSQVPEKMSYQAVVRNAAGDLVKSSNVGMRISVLHLSVSGTVIYSETQIASTNTNGLLSLEIGGGTPLTGTFAGIDWSSGPYFIKTETDPEGGLNYSAIVGTSQLMSVPYAMYAKSAGSVNDLMDQLYDQGSLKPVDGDGNLYNVVKIGNQRWLKENLKTTKYNDGTVIPNVTDNTTWNSLSTGAYCDYANNPTNSSVYGKLYNWYSAGFTNPKNLCPIGWKVPSDNEWTILTSYLGGISVAGGKIKEAGTIHWASPNTGATNETGFTALPGGCRGGLGTFLYLGNLGLWWTGSEAQTIYGAARYLNFDYTGISPNEYSKYQGLSVRCVRVD